MFFAANEQHHNKISLCKMPLNRTFKQEELFEHVLVKDYLMHGLQGWGKNTDNGGQVICTYCLGTSIAVAR